MNVPDVPHCSAFYQHLLGTESALKHFLIHHIPADRFRHVFAASFRILVAIPGESWQKKRCPGFLISVNHCERSWEEAEELARGSRSGHFALLCRGD